MAIPPSGVRVTMTPATRDWRVRSIGSTVARSRSSEVTIDGRPEAVSARLSDPGISRVPVAQPDRSPEMRAHETATHDGSDAMANSTQKELPAEGALAVPFAG